MSHEFMMIRRVVPYLTLGLFLCVVSLMAGVARADSARETVFDRINTAERRAHVARKGVHRFKRLAKKQDALIETAREDVALTRRVALTSRKRALARQSTWERLFRVARRHAMAWDPGVFADTQRLLSIAEPRSHELRRDEYALITSTHYGEQHVAMLVKGHAQTLRGLAQQSALSVAAQAEREGAFARARLASARHMRRDLEETDARLYAIFEDLMERTSQKDFHRYKGTLVHPIRQKLVQAFESRGGCSARYIRCSGLTYKANEGQLVRAVASGTIVHQGYFEGFGQVVILDHGGSYHSVYAHLSKTLLRQGAKVRRHDSIAYTGSTGSLEGSMLYFELRHKGLPINPTPWFVH